MEGHNQHNINSYLIFYTFAIYIAYEPPKDKRLKRFSIFLEQPVYSEPEIYQISTT